MSAFMLWPSADWTATRKCNRVKGCAQMRRPICSSTFYAALLSSRLGQNQGRNSCPSRFSSVHWGAGGPQFLWFTLRKVGFYNSLQKRTRERNKRTKIRRFQCWGLPASLTSKSHNSVYVFWAPTLSSKVQSGIFLQHVIFLHNSPWAGEVAQSLRAPTALNQLAPTNSGWSQSMKLACTHQQVFCHCALHP